MEEKDREIWIKENKFYFGNDNILYITLVGEIDDKIAERIKDMMNRYSDEIVHGKINVLCDINKAGKSSVEARKIYKEILDRNIVNKVAMFGMHPVARILAVFMIQYLRINIARFFKTREQALAWLKEK